MKSVVYLTQHIQKPFLTSVLALLAKDDIFFIFVKIYNIKPILLFLYEDDKTLDKEKQMFEICAARL